MFIGFILTMEEIEYYNDYIQRLVDYVAKETPLLPKNIGINHRERIVEEINRVNKHRNKLLLKWTNNAE